MSGLRERKKRDVRDALYAAAIAQIEANGYEAVSVDQIVQAVGVAKGTFFNHFPSKADVVAEWYSRLIGKTLAEYRQGRARGLASQLVHLALMSNRLSQAAPALWRAKNALAVSSAAIQAAEREGDAAIEKFAHTLVAGAMGRREIRADVDAAAFARLYTSLVTGAVRQWIVVGGGAGLERRLRDRVATLCQLAAPGLASGASPGQK